MTTEILTNASPEQLSLAIENNLDALFRAMVDLLPGSELYESDKLNRHLTFPHNPMFKCVWRTRLAPTEVEAAIDETIAWFQARNAPFFCWVTGPGTLPVDLGERLAARGLVSLDELQSPLAHPSPPAVAGAPIMVADLQHLNESALDQVPDGFVIESVRDERSLLDFIGVFVETFGMPEWMGQAWVDATLYLGFDRSPWKMHLGRLNGAPVATHLLYHGGGVAGVYAIGTVASARGKGIGGAITLQPLLAARALGYRYAVLFATQMGIRAYRRIGFQLTEGRINRFLWSNPSPLLP